MLCIICYGEEHLGNTCMVRNPVNIPAQPYNNRLNRDLLTHTLHVNKSIYNIYSIKGNVCVCDPRLYKSTAPEILKFL